jgi:hypothetical protein
MNRLRDTLALKNDDSLDKAAEWFMGGLAVLATILATVGVLTEGIARMFRNSSSLLIAGAFGLVIASTALAALSRAFNKPYVGAATLIVSALTFAIGITGAVNLMVASTSKEDRPALSVQFVRPGDDGDWRLKVKASTTGLSAQGMLRVFIYAQPPSASVGLVTPIHGATSDNSLTPAGMPSQSPPEEAEGTASSLIAGDRLFFAQTGPNIDGAAGQEFELPLNAGHKYDTYIVTADLGGHPGSCKGYDVDVASLTKTSMPNPIVSTPVLSPSAESSMPNSPTHASLASLPNTSSSALDRDEEQSVACVVLAAPSQ